MMEIVMTDACRQFVLASRTVGKVKESDLRLEVVDQPEPAAGEFLVRNEY